MSCAIDATAKTISATDPTTVARLASAIPRACSRATISAARPVSRSSSILGSAKVVDWKITEDTAVVRNTMAETWINARAIVCLQRRGISPWRRGPRWQTGLCHHLVPHDCEIDRTPSRIEIPPGTKNAQRQPAIVDHVAGDEGREAHAQISPDAVHGDPHAGVLPLGRHDGQTHRDGRSRQRSPMANSPAPNCNGVRGEPGDDRHHPRCR